MVGIDAFKDIRTWKEWETLLNDYAFIVHGRPGYALGAAYEVIPPVMRPRLWEVPTGRPLPTPAARDGASIYLVSALTLNVSSTAIRALVRQGSSIRYLVPDAVEAYVVEHRLYQGGGA